ncbi:BgTH12-00528 [Blumeria graminis f. sp. triticale]|uniref:BgTH12-00528 n=1 Tax=Blumeria graminis f. sp. triticale TaxID=1689686 RepID=A0A9W4GGV6_BLUGR|nr:BgTH12-00528 [Blumeria graminis f. sp. triticale]
MSYTTPSSRTSTNLLRVTPSNSQNSRALRSPNKPRGLSEMSLSLKRIIGTTVSSPNAFDASESSSIYAYTAGAAAVVVNANDAEYVQRFFRARPTAVAFNSTACSLVSTTTGAHDGKSRTVGGNRDLSLPNPQYSSYDASEWLETTSSKTWSSRERIKAATSLSISRDSRFLAVGETGYAPRVLIFSLQESSSDYPLTIINEHTYGVRAVVFSPDSSYLASLGNTNDGFIYIWRINSRTGAAKLHSSNKCTSAVKQMIWLGENSVVTVGTRHIKIWRVVDARRNLSPAKQKNQAECVSTPNQTQSLPSTLIGRNVLLGPLVEATFTAIVAISDHQAFVCSEKGDICLMDDSEGPKLVRLVNVHFSITCIAFDLEARQIRIGGKNGRRKSISVDSLISQTISTISPQPAEEASTCDSGHICAMGYAGRNLVSIDSNHSIEISRLDSSSVDFKRIRTPLAAHSDAVLGVSLISESEQKVKFLTWSADGTIVFWDIDGMIKSTIKVKLEQLASADDDLTNQCTVVRASNKAEFLVYGDRYGVLRVVNLIDQEYLFETRAHSSDINGIALHESTDLTLLATCGRDHMVQIFQLSLLKWTLVQTLNDHTAGVTNLFFVEGDKLVSSSTDRTVHIRQISRKVVDRQEIMVVLPLRIITVKASPVFIEPYFADNGLYIIISLLDRTIATYEMLTGRLVMSFKASDSDGSEAVALDSLALGAFQPSLGSSAILAGVSSMDKSIRVYDINSGMFLDREWGHTTNITDVAFFNDPDTNLKTIISTGSDGTIMIWSLSSRLKNSPDNSEASPCINDVSPPKETPSFRAPLRRVISRADLAEFQRMSPAAISEENELSPRIRRKISKYKLSSTQAPPSMSSLGSTKLSPTAPDDVSTRRSITRPRSQSPPSTRPVNSDARRPSFATYSKSKTKTKSTPLFNEYCTLNMATEQACRILRTYRKKLLSSESLKDSAIKELDHELRLTAVALGEKSQKSQTISEKVLAGLLDEYSDRLVSLFDKKLHLSSRLSLADSDGAPVHNCSSTDCASVQPSP